MVINIKFTNIQSSPAITEYVEEKLNHIYKFIEKFDLEGAVKAQVELGRVTNHHHKGQIFRAEVNLVLPHKALRAEHEGYDLHGAIDLMKDRLEREVIKYKETV